MSASDVDYAPAARDQERLSLTGHERTFSPDQIIVSKTDTRGIMTYVNQLFLEISGYTEDEMLGRPHSAIRHPHMPRCVFKLLWDTIKRRQEIFAYVINRCKNGDHYWVLAHVTPTFDSSNEMVGYHSSRRSPRREALAVIQPLYHELQGIEQQGGRAGMEASLARLHDVVGQRGMPYDQFILTI